ncbi:MAG TPA: hypothetical protein VHC22_33250 [Pirellulales bacterium]|nr:hypothetical protein [Pirellulales bacterium]
MTTNETTDNAPGQMAGRYVLLAVFGLGLAGAGGGWWYQHSLQRHPLQLWGGDAARLILRANNAELCRLGRAVELVPPGAIVAEGEPYRVDKCVDAARIPGFLHLRHSLVNDYSFDWNDADTVGHDWGFALRFREGEQSATVLLSADFQYALLVETGGKACIRPIARGVREIVGEAFGDATAEP